MGGGSVNSDGIENKKNLNILLELLLPAAKNSIRTHN